MEQDGPNEHSQSVAPGEASHQLTAVNGQREGLDESPADVVEEPVALLGELRVSLGLLQQSQRDDGHIRRRQLVGQGPQLLMQPGADRCGRVLKEGQVGVPHDGQQQLRGTGPVSVDGGSPDSGRTGDPLVGLRSGSFLAQQHPACGQDGVAAAHGARIVGLLPLQQHTRRIDSKNLRAHAV